MKTCIIRLLLGLAVLEGVLSYRTSTAARVRGGGDRWSRPGGRHGGWLGGSVGHGGGGGFGGIGRGGPFVISKRSANMPRPDRLIALNPEDRRGSGPAGRIRSGPSPACLRCWGLGGGFGGGIGGGVVSKRSVSTDLVARSRRPGGIHARDFVPGGSTYRSVWCRVCLQHGRKDVPIIMS